MKFLFFILTVFTLLGGSANAQETENRLPGFPIDKFYVGKIIEIKDASVQPGVPGNPAAKEARVRIASGDEKDKEVVVLFATGPDAPEQYGLEVGDTIVVQKTEALGEIEYGIYDRYRITPLIFITIIFFAAVIAFARIKGVGSIFGLGISIAILAGFVVPRILNGGDPLFTSLAGAIGIALLSLYTAHGFTKRTSVALVSTTITLGISSILAVLFVKLTNLFGFGSEGALYLQTGPLEGLNLQGLLLGGIIIGALGVLDDITTSQTAVVDEIKKANASLPFKELYRRGVSVGKEHVSSLVNTLVLAYAGASFPLFLLFSVNPSGQPWWVIVNSEFIAEEIVRTLVGSVTLVLAVPIATLIAAYFFSRQRASEL